jgi:hypothetical protein
MPIPENGSTSAMIANFSKEAVFDKYAQPLITQLIEVCQEHGLGLFAICCYERRLEIVGQNEDSMSTTENTGTNVTKMNLLQLSTHARLATLFYKMLNDDPTLFDNPMKLLMTLKAGEQVVTEHNQELLAKSPTPCGEEAAQFMSKLMDEIGEQK